MFGKFKAEKLTNNLIAEMGTNCIGVIPSLKLDIIQFEKEDNWEKKHYAFVDAKEQIAYGYSVIRRYFIELEKLNLDAVEYNKQIEIAKQYIIKFSMSASAVRGLISLAEYNCEKIDKNINYVRNLIKTKYEKQNATEQTM